MIYVLDASVVLKWFLIEEGTQEALELKKEYEAGEISIAAPDLLIYEVINVLRFKKHFSEIILKKSLDSLIALNLELFSPSEHIIEESIHISCHTNLSIYDCSYLALSHQLNTLLITTDKTVFNSAKQLHFKIKSLTD